MRKAGALTLLLCLPLCLPPGARAATDQRPKEMPAWVWLVPGGGQFYLGQRNRGAVYAAGTLSLFGWGVYAADKKASGEINAPFLYAQQLYVVGAYDAYKEHWVRKGWTGGSVPVDPTPVRDLVLAPFTLETLKSPWVLGAMVVGAGLNLASVKFDSHRRGYGNLRRVRYLGDSYNKEWGAAAYSAYWIPVSIGAGSAEEMLFRGIFQADMERSWGPTTGLCAASGLFGAAHLQRLNSAESWGQVGFAAAAGLYLGWRYQRKGYRLKEPIAAHVWFDIAAGLTLFFADPKENPLGAEVNYAF